MPFLDSSPEVKKTMTMSDWLVAVLKVWGWPILLVSVALLAVLGGIGFGVVLYDFGIWIGKLIRFIASQP